MYGACGWCSLPFRDPARSRGFRPSRIHIRHLGIHKECTKLMQALKSHFNGLDARIVIAHPIKQNLFLKTLRYNYLP